MVLVQAGQSLPDNQWNLDLTAHDKDLYRGLVGNLSEVIGTDRFQPSSTNFAKTGVTRLPSFRPIPGKADRSFRDLEARPRSEGRWIFFGKVQACRTPRPSPPVCPELKIIIDHLGNVRLDGEPLDPQWVSGSSRWPEGPTLTARSPLFTDG